MNSITFGQDRSATLEDIRNEISGASTALLMIYEELKALRMAIEGQREGDRNDL